MGNAGEELEQHRREGNVYARGEETGEEGWLNALKFPPFVFPSPPAGFSSSSFAYPTYFTFLIAPFPSMFLLAFSSVTSVHFSPSMLILLFLSYTPFYFVSLLHFLLTPILLFAFSIISFLFLFLFPLIFLQCYYLVFFQPIVPYFSCSSFSLSLVLLNSVLLFAFSSIFPFRSASHISRYYPLLSVFPAVIGFFFPSLVFFSVYLAPFPTLTLYFVFLLFHLFYLSFYSTYSSFSSAHH